MSMVPTRHVYGNWKHKSRPKVKAQRRFTDEKHLAFIRTLPCVVAGGQAEAHHLLFVPTNERGGAMKSGDCWTIPIGHWHHMKLHETGERSYLAALSIYGPGLAALLYQMSGNTDACLRALQECRG